MHSSKIARVRSIAIALAMILSVFGTKGLRAQQVTTQKTVTVDSGGSCPTYQISCKDAAHARHEAAEDHARAERAQKKAADKAAKLRAEADEEEREGAQDAAKYEGKANKHLEDAGLICPANEQTAQTTVEKSIENPKR
jgi:hypothetical protein